MTWLVWYLSIGAIFTIVRFAISIAGSKYVRSRGGYVATDFDTSGASLPAIIASIIVELAVWPLTLIYIAFKVAVNAPKLVSMLWTARKLRIAQEAGE